MRSSVLPLPLKGEKFGGIVVLEKKSKIAFVSGGGDGDDNDADGEADDDDDVDHM